jgi:hypothetical protein
LQAAVKRMEGIFDDLKERVEREHKKRLDELFNEFKKVQTPDGYNRIRQQLGEEFEMYSTGSRQFFGVALVGPQAESGLYRLHLVLNGQTYERYLRVREDPLFESIIFPSAKT